MNKKCSFVCIRPSVSLYSNISVSRPLVEWLMHNHSYRQLQRCTSCPCKLLCSVYGQESTVHRAQLSSLCSSHDRLAYGPVQLQSYQAPQLAIHRYEEQLGECHYRVSLMSLVYSIMFTSLCNM